LPLHPGLLALKTMISVKADDFIEIMETFQDVRLKKLSRRISQLRGIDVGDHKQQR